MLERLFSSRQSSRTIFKYAFLDDPFAPNRCLYPERKDSKQFSCLVCLFLCQPGVSRLLFRHSPTHTSVGSRASLFISLGDNKFIWYFKCNGFVSSNKSIFCMASLRLFPKARNFCNITILANYKRIAKIAENLPPPKSARLTSRVLASGF